MCPYMLVSGITSACAGVTLYVKLEDFKIKIDKNFFLALILIYNP